MPHSATSKSQTLFVVAVGASAGGLDSFQDLLSGLGDAPDMAIVFVQHLDSSSQSLLPESLNRSTDMEVVEVNGRRKLKPATVYVCPPQALLALKNGFVSVTQQDEAQRNRTPIDHFFHSVAEDQDEYGIGVILSGSGSDGTLGLKSISDHGGITFAQDPASARFDSMPRSAATTGVADHVLPPREIAVELQNYVQHLRSIEALQTDKQRRGEIKEAIPAIAERLSQVTQHNFQHYKPNSLIRRIQRRMQVLKVPNVDDYVALLQRQEDEVRQLFRELLIGVTAFFRDESAFDSLRELVLPKLFENRSSEDCVRIWVAGCATGQEAYSLAILCHEVMAELESTCQLQIFATDIDEHALQIARAGTYPIGIEEQVSRERLKRFFTNRGKHYQIKKMVRESVLFSVHNLISDPPFSRLDLISCRNLMIYLGAHLQNKLIPLFHYALRPAGYLFLGPSEKILSHGDLFRSLDVRHRISQRKGTAIASRGSNQHRIPRHSTSKDNAQDVSHDRDTDLTEIRQRITLDEFAPKSVVINESGQILNASANMERYLTVSGGDYQNNIVKMTARGLRIGLRAAIAEAKRTRRRVEHENMSIRVGELTQRVMITVQPMPRLGEDEALYLVVFQDVGNPFQRENSAESTDANQATHDQESLVTQLEWELETTREDLDKTLQDIEAANEELKSSNQELLSINEELQSANEELETSKEEIRASSDAIARAHDDLENLLRSTQIATVFLDDELRIRNFTPAIADLYDLIATDIGRPLEMFVPNAANMPPLPDPSQIRKGEATEDTVDAHSGRSYIRRVLPYRSHTGSEEGVVVTFTDVTQLRESKELFQLLVDASSQIVWVTDAEGKVTEDSPSWRAFTGQSIDEWLGEGWLNAIHEDDRERTIQTWLSTVKQQTPFSCEYRIWHQNSDAYRWAHSRALPQRDANGSVKRWVGMCTDITERKRHELDLSTRESHLRRVINHQLGLVGLIDRSGLLVEIDDRSLEIANTSREQVVGKHFAKTPWWTYSSEVERTIRDAMDRAFAGETVRFDVSLFAEDDDGVYIDFMIAPVFDDNGEVEYLIPSGVDIGARHAAERQLALAKARLELSMTFSKVAPWSWNMHTNEVIVEEGLKNLLGFGSDEAADLESIMNRIDESHRDRVAKAIEDAIANKGIFDEEYIINLPNGERRWLHGRGQTALSRTGDVEDFFGVVSDITDRKQIQLELADREAQLRRVIDNTVGFIGVLSPDGTLLEANAPALRSASLEREELIGQKFWDTYWWNFDPALQSELKHLIERAAGGESIRCDMRYRVSGDQRRVLDFMLNPVIDESGNVTHLIPSAVDILDRKEAEAAVVESQRKLQLGIDVAALGLAEVDYATKRVELSREAARLYGFGDEPLTVTRDELHARFHPEDREKVVSSIQQNLDSINDGEISDRHRIVLPNGDIRWLDIRKRVFFDYSVSPPVPVRGTLVARDVTQEVQFQTELDESRQRLSLAMEAAQMGAFEWQPDTDVAHWDDQWCEVIGIDKNAPRTGKTLFDLIHPDDLHVFKAARPKDATENTDYKVEFRIIRPDGELRWLAACGTLFPGRDGQPTRLVGVNWDITDQKLTAERLRQGEERLRLALKSGNMAAWEWSPTGSIWTEEVYEMLGLPSDQPASSELFFQNVHPEDVEELKLVWQKATLGEAVYEHEFRIIRPDGEIRWMVGVGEVVRNKQGEVVSLYGLNWDSTDEHLTAERLRESERAAVAANQSKSAFVANMSHEIRTPMTAILGYADLISDMIDDPEAIRHLQTIRRNGDYLLDIINDILDLSKIEAGKLDVECERFQPARLIEDVRSVMAVRANEGGLALEVEYEGKLPKLIESDAKRLKQILINLVGNAIKFTRKGHVKIRVRYETAVPKQSVSECSSPDGSPTTNHGYMHFDIADTGIGMSQEQQDRLFKPFSQGDSTVSRQFGGTGLGLAISKRLAEMLGGEISLVSTEGVGSTFTLTVDAGDQDDIELINYSSTSTLDAKHPSASASVVLRCHVLIVDDRRDIRFLSKRLLNKAGATVDECEDGQVAVDHMKAHLGKETCPDLILLDMQMPNLDGYQTAKILRMLGYKGPIIALTADAMQGDMNECLEAGCNDYLSKPIDSGRLIQMVADMTFRDC
ncbi:PAS domain-containing protein [Aporhodopirellula aestuarii]|uniref:histidine kinase n=1 Tax=Aporhodopirellula aestuarii TaxID=2950107 RepID=A0ABT0TZK6_9BACT|nr:PAS domain-containing protein [Aporhodopirellula aestuarii]MCM2369668.1 PAS domain-containing protein [Aporhodopirellula aestuarii]